MKMVWKPHKNCNCPTKTKFHAQKLLEYQFKVKITFKKKKIFKPKCSRSAPFCGGGRVSGNKTFIPSCLISTPSQNVLSATNS